MLEKFTKAIWGMHLEFREHLLVTVISSMVTDLGSLSWEPFW